MTVDGLSLGEAIFSHSSIDRAASLERDRVKELALFALSQTSVMEIIISNLSFTRRDVRSVLLTSKDIKNLSTVALGNYFSDSLKDLFICGPEIVEIARRNLSDAGILNPTPGRLYIEVYETLVKMVICHRRELNELGGENFIDRVRRGFSIENALDMYRFLRDINLIKIFKKISFADQYLLSGISFDCMAAKVQAMREYLNHNSSLLHEVTELNLRKSNLTMIPPEIGKFTGLVYLWLDNNYIQTIPAEIGQLELLQVLFLSNNQIIAIPSQAGSLVHLRHFWLDNNLIQYIPAEIRSLKELIDLYLSHNLIHNVPIEVNQLRALRCLHLENNPISNIPPEVRGMPIFL